MRLSNAVLKAPENREFRLVIGVIEAVSAPLFCGLENRCTRERTVGSNPTPSARTFSPYGTTHQALHKSAVFQWFVAVNGEPFVSVWPRLTEVTRDFREYSLEANLADTNWGDWG